MPNYLLDLAKTLLDHLAGLLTPLIAMIAAYIAWQQHKTNKNRLKFEMYHEKYAIYKSLQVFITQIITSGTTDYAKVATCRRETRESEFFFEEDIEKYLKEIFDKAIELHAVHETYSPLSVGSERSRLVDKETKLLEWFNMQSQIASSKFGKYLKLTDL